MVKVAKMLKRHLPNLLTYFRHRITNAMSEGFNSVIQALRYAAVASAPSRTIALASASTVASSTSRHSYRATEMPEEPASERTGRRVGLSLWMPRGHTSPAYGHAVSAQAPLRCLRSFRSHSSFISSETGLNVLAMTSSDSCGTPRCRTIRATTSRRSAAKCS